MLLELCFFNHVQLFQYEKDRYMQNGIVAWGIGCGQDGTPGVYVDVGYLRYWIDNEMTRLALDTSSYTFIP